MGKMRGILEEARSAGLAMLSSASASDGIWPAGCSTISPRLSHWLLRLCPEAWLSSDVPLATILLSAFCADFREFSLGAHSFPSTQLPIIKQPTKSIVL